MTAGYAVDGTRQDHPEDGQRAAAEETTAGLVRVVVQPAGRRVDVAARDEPCWRPSGPRAWRSSPSAGAAGYAVPAGCSSGGGSLTPPTEQERELLAPAELSAGVRLACQAAVAADMRVDVPPESLTTPQRLVSSRAAPRACTALDPAVVALDVQVRPPGDSMICAATPPVSGTRSPRRASRWRGPASPCCPPPRDPARPRSWAARAAVHRCGTGEGGEIIALLPEGTVPLGAAIDVGTTKLAAYLVNLETGETVAKGAAPNPQMAIGEDVMSRIAYADAQRPGAHGLHARLARRHQPAARRAPWLRSAPPAWQLVDAVAVGNTAMHHLLVNLPVRQLGRAPYVPAVTEALSCALPTSGLSWPPARKSTCRRTSPGSSAPTNVRRCSPAAPPRTAEPSSSST